MDCKTAKEKMNIFDSLSQKEKDEVLAHAAGCKKCQKELINSAKLREELASLDELEAPDGLAQSAIEKAKRKFKFPSYAYISVAAAAVIAVAFFATSSLLRPGGQTADEAMPIAKEENLRTNDEAFGAEEGEVMMASEMAEDTTASAPQADAAMDYADDAGEVAAEAADDSVEREDGEEEQICSILIPAEKKSTSDAIQIFLENRGIYYDRILGEGSQEILQFVIGELDFAEFEELLIVNEIEYDGMLLPRNLIQVTIEN